MRNLQVLKHTNASNMRTLICKFNRAPVQRFESVREFITRVLRQNTKAVHEFYIHKYGMNIYCETYLQDRVINKYKQYGS